MFVKEEDWKMVAPELYWLIYFVANLQNSYSADALILFETLYL